MTFSTANLHRILQTPPPGDGYGPGCMWLSPVDHPANLEALIRAGQNRFKAPHLRDYGYRLPVPFRWGPNGGLLLLLAMLAPALGLAIWAALG